MKLDQENHLAINGMNLLRLSRESPFPIYVIDESILRKNMREYVLGLQEFYKGPSQVYYATKALMNIAMCYIAASEGLSLDVASGGELYTAIKAQFPMERVILHGNNKLDEELEMAVHYGVGRIVIDNLEEIARLSSVCEKYQKRMKVLVRIKPGIEAETHRFMVTGTDDSKFGFTMSEALNAIEEIHSTPFLEFMGIHFHVGSQIHQPEVYERSIEVATDFIRGFKDWTVKELNVGGGLGIDSDFSTRSYLELISRKVMERFSMYGLPLPKLMIEPGRSIAATAGLTLYKIGSVKRLPSGIVCAAVNGGMSDNIRPALYGAKYEAALLNRMDEAPICLTKIVGKCCETGDVLISEIMLPEPKRGDVLALFNTGAYCYSMASHYNRLPIPGIALVSNGSFRWMVRPETYEDLLKCDEKDGKALSRILS